MLFGCANETKNKDVSYKPITISLQAFNDVDMNDISNVFLHLKKVYPFIKQKQSVNLPSFAFYPAKGRYKADSLIKFLSNKASNDEVVIDFTGMDISTHNGAIPDWELWD